MPADPVIQVPFLLDLSNPQFDKAVIFFVAMLTAITVNAESQAFAATLLGDVCKDQKDRFHFNPLLHLDPAGILCFLAAGFGWPRQVTVQKNRLNHPKVGLILVRFAGPLGNLLLAGITGSILWIMRTWGMEDQVFSMVLTANLMFFVFGFLPLPPLAGATLLSVLIPETLKQSVWSNRLFKASPYALAALMITMRIREWTVFEGTLHAMVKQIFIFLST